MTFELHPPQIVTPEGETVDNTQSSVFHHDDMVTLHHGNALDVARTLPTGLAQTIVTSPPYFGLRDYGEDAQIGAEESPQAFVTALVDLFRELRRVLADDGTAWINLGDSYAGSWGNQGRKETRGTQRPINGGMITPVHDGRYPSKGSGTGSRKPGEPPAKNLIGIPWRVAFGLQDDGWILRSDIIWAKPNFMPESVTDRVTKQHEYIFMLSKKPRYYFDAEAIREDSDPVQEEHNRKYAREYEKHSERAATTGQPGNVNNVGIHSRPGRGGRNKRSVWNVSTVPFPGAHFAVYPPELIRPCILAGSRPGDVVLDPFSGSGTTGMVATQEGRRYVGIDLNADYLDLSLRTRFRQPSLDIFGGAS